MHEIYSTLEQIYTNEVKTYWQDQPFVAAIGFGNFYYFFDSHRREIIPYSSGTNLAVTVDAIHKQLPKFQDLQQNDGSLDPLIERFEAYFSQVGLAIQNNNQP